MPQIAGNTAGGPLNFQSLVDIKPDPLRRVASCQPQAPLGIPRVPDPIAAVEIQPVDEEAPLRQLAVSQNCTNGQRQFGRYGFIRVETQHPGLSAEPESGIFLCDIALPGLHFEAGSELRSYFPRTVGRARIENHDFRREASDAFQAAREISLLIERNERDGKRQRRVHEDLILDLARCNQCFQFNDSGETARVGRRGHIHALHELQDFQEELLGFQDEDENEG